MKVITLSDTIDLNKMVEEEVRDLMLDLHASLVEATPVDTGNAREGWTVDVPNRVIENNVEYINRLNEGHSQQAPAGFVEAEIDRATRL